VDEAKGRRERPLHVLFVCSYGRMRSPTAANLFRDYPGLETSWGGTSSFAEVPVDAARVDWADAVFVMEPTHRDALRERFSAQLADKPVVVLGIPDLYPYMDPELVGLLRAEVIPQLDRLTGRA